MSRFDASTADERRALFAEAIGAHRERASAFCTFETDEPVGSSDSDEEPVPLPWLQFADDTFNLDCTDAELARLKQLVGDYPEFRIDALDSPEDADGTNVRVTARSDPNRLAGFADRVFLDVYDAPDDYRVWAVEV